MLERFLPTYRFRTILCVLPSITHDAFFAEGFENYPSTGELSAPGPHPHTSQSRSSVETAAISYITSIQSLHISGHKPNLPELHSQHIIHQLPHVVAADFSPLVVTQGGEFSFIRILANCTALRALTLDDLHSDKLNIANKVALENLHGGWLLMPQLERLTMYTPLSYSPPTDRMAETIISRWQRTALMSVELLFYNHCEGMGK